MVELEPELPNPEMQEPNVCEDKTEGDEYEVDPEELHLLKSSLTPGVEERLEQ